MLTTGASTPTRADRRRALHRRLVTGAIDPFEDHSARSVVDLVLAAPQQGRHRRRAHVDRPRPGGRLSLDLSEAEMERWERRLPEGEGEIGRLEERPDRFEIRVVLERGRDAMRVATYVVHKQTWEAWWSSAAPTLHHGRAMSVTVADERWSPDVSGWLATVDVADAPCVPDDTWKRGPADVPDPRQDQTAVWTGTELIVWGGYDGGYLNTGGRYDPTTATWAPTSTTGAPASRRWHAAVWADGEMIVWGGYDGITHFNTGGRYDPATDAWTPTSTTGAPSGRERHTSVWTGSVMVIWGGRTGATTLATGGRYDPSTDTWTPTATTGAPQERNSHTAVWTGSEMIVWGGFDAAHLDTGARYDPDVDTWAPTSNTGPPSGRSYHTAVWTGTEMIVWGGAGDDPYFLDTGGRYDPGADTWSPTTTTGAPTARFHHTAVWIGAEMVVWGGLGGLTTGARYGPATDGWTPTSDTNRPEGRRFHTAVWTGSFMIVWGGRGSSPTRSLNSWGLYALGHSDDGDGDGLSECDGDCNDLSDVSHPGADEICDHLDNDCDGETDEGVTAPDWYRDGDGDGYGDPDDSRQSCFRPPGYVSDNTDCDDADDQCLDECGADACIGATMRQVLAAISDINANNAPELAVLHTDEATGRTRV